MFPIYDQIWAPSHYEIVFHVAMSPQVSCGQRLYIFSISQVVFFDNDGHVTMVEESQKKKRQSEANLYVVPYGR